MAANVQSVSSERVMLLLVEQHYAILDKVLAFEEAIGVFAGKNVDDTQARDDLKESLEALIQQIRDSRDRIGALR